MILQHCYWRHSRLSVWNWKKNPANLLSWCHKRQSIVITHYSDVTGTWASLFTKKTTFYRDIQIPIINLRQSDDYLRVSGGQFNIKSPSYQYRHPIMKMRQSWDHFWSIMGIIILVRQHFFYWINNRWSLQVQKTQICNKFVIFHSQRNVSYHVHL